jgi:hypothetical protein
MLTVIITILAVVLGGIIHTAASRQPSARPVVIRTQRRRR